jgi:hypothetical protein
MGKTGFLTKMSGVRAGVRKTAHNLGCLPRPAGQERQEIAMYGIDDVRTEVRKITSSKPVHAAAGAGVLATQTLRELPGRLVRGIDGTVMSWPARATEYVQTARAKAAGQYDLLADRGKQALAGKDDEPAKSVLNGTASTAKASTAKASTAKASTTKAGTSK